MEAFVNGLTTVSPEPSSKCTGTQKLAESWFQKAWNWMSWTERAACVAVGFPICWTIFCSGIV